MCSCLTESIPHFNYSLYCGELAALDVETTETRFAVYADRNNILLDISLIQLHN